MKLLVLNIAFTLYINALLSCLFCSQTDKQYSTNQAVSFFHSSTLSHLLWISIKVVLSFKWYSVWRLWFPYYPIPHPNLHLPPIGSVTTTTRTHNLEDRAKQVALQFWFGFLAGVHFPFTLLATCFPASCLLPLQSIFRKMADCCLPTITAVGQEMLLLPSLNSN